MHGHTDTNLLPFLNLFFAFKRYEDFFFFNKIIQFVFVSNVIFLIKHRILFSIMVNVLFVTLWSLSLNLQPLHDALGLLQCQLELELINYNLIIAYELLCSLI